MSHDREAIRLQHDYGDHQPGSAQLHGFSGEVHRRVFQDFLSRLIRQYAGRMFLLVDRHSVHRSAQIRDWREVHKDRIRLFFLPGYRPELNPDELFNQDVKSNALGRRRARDEKELLSNTRSYLRSRQIKPEIVKKYFHGQHVRYAA